MPDRSDFAQGIVDHASEILHRSETAYERMGDRSMVGFAKLPSGYEIVVSSHTNNPDQFDPKVAKDLCFDKLMVEVIELIAAQDSVPTA